MVSDIPISQAEPTLSDPHQQLDVLDNPGIDTLCPAPLPPNLFTDVFAIHDPTIILAVCGTKPDRTSTDCYWPWLPPKTMHHSRVLI